MRTVLPIYFPDYLLNLVQYESSTYTFHLSRGRQSYHLLKICLSKGKFLEFLKTGT